MSWLEENYDGKTTLPWWKESFRIASEALLLKVDECSTEDIQVHGMQWMVQEVQNARITVDELDESDSWFRFQDTAAAAKDPNDPDYWGDDNDEGEEDAGPKKVQDVAVFDQVFVELGFSLKALKAMQSELEDWMRLGSKRRLGKHVWHSWRFFKRVKELRLHVQKVMDLADVDIYAFFRDEPNSGVHRCLEHPALLWLWRNRIAPRVLASKASMRTRAPPCVHPSRLPELLSRADAVLQAPLCMVAEELVRLLTLSREEKIVLPYLLASGCSDQEYGGKYTFGGTPLATDEAMASMQARAKAARTLVKKGPNGKGWGESKKAQETKHRAEEEAKTLSESVTDAEEQRAECIDCSKLQEIMSYWCPPAEVRRHATIKVEEIVKRPELYMETRKDSNRMKILPFEMLLLRLKMDPRGPIKTRGARAMGARAVFRAGAMVLIFAVRISRLSPHGMRQSLAAKREQIIEQTLENDDHLGTASVKVDSAREDERLRAEIEEDRTRAVSRGGVSTGGSSGRARQREYDNQTAEKKEELSHLVVDYNQTLNKSRDLKAALIDLDRRIEENEARDIGPAAIFPLRAAIKAAAASLVWVDSGDRLGARQDSKMVDWFWFECCLDFTKIMVQESKEGSFMLRYSKEPGVFVVNWSLGIGQPVNSARIFRVQHVKTAATEEREHRASDDDSDSEHEDRGEKAEEKVFNGFAWSTTASPLETYETLQSLLHAARGVLRHSLSNRVPQLYRKAGYL